MNTQEMIKQYQENQEKLKALGTQSTVFHEAKREESRKVEYIFWDREKIIRQERDAGLEKINEQIRDYEGQAKEERVELSEAIHKVERIIAYLKLGKRDLEIDIYTIKHRDRDEGKYLEWLDYLYSDDFLNIRLLIAENDKPKNKYRLCGYGKCLFHDELLKLPYGCGMNLLDYQSRCNIQVVINDFDSIDKLKSWLSKNRDKILQEFLVEYQGVKAEYLEVMANYRLKDFQEIADVY